MRLLAWVPECTDRAVARLEELAMPSGDARLWSDLAGAYSVRAQRKDQPADLVRALDAADRAVALAPALPEARFNRALAEESLGFRTEAIRAWDALRTTAGVGWAAEAAERAARLTREQRVAAAMQWHLAEDRLRLAARAGDHKAMVALVSPHRAAAQRYVEDTILPRWADAHIAGNADAAEEQLRMAEMIGTALAELTRERYVLDIVAPVRAASAARANRMAEAFQAFAEARATEKRQRNEKTTSSAYAAAERALESVGSPLRLRARIRRAAFASIAGRFDEVATLLPEVEHTAERLRYPTYRGLVCAARAFVAVAQGRYLDALADYGDADEAFGVIGDTENRHNVLTRNIGVYRLIGNERLTWREVFKTRDLRDDVTDPASRHLFYGESALSALQLGYPRVALRYQNAAIALLQRELAAKAGDETQVGHIRHNLGIAFRARAAIHAHLGDTAAARSDLALGEPEGGRARPGDAAILDGFRARLYEAEAQTLQNTDRQRAITALSRGIDHASRTPFRSLVASLFLQRADLHRLGGDAVAEVADLRAALRELRQEERAMLSARRVVSQAEQMWSPYFSRYQETYRRLIQRLVEDGNDAEAFAYAERARAFEPLHRILLRSDVPSAFRLRIRDGEPFGLQDVQETLADRTYLLQYAVLNDHTYVWIIWKGDAQRTTLPVGNAEIEQWAATLQRFGGNGEVELFRDALEPPFLALLREPLARVAKLSGDGPPPRVVIVPDRAMHGLPFNALRNGDRYVVQDHRVSVAASATLHAYSVARDAHHAAAPAESILIVADPAFNPRLEVARGLHRLTRAQAEAERIADVYRGRLDIEPLVGPRATPAAFLDAAARSSIIHVAAHGIANPDIPSRSFLLLAPSGNDSGAIDAERLMSALRLENARLAVLAACSSAGGTPVGPEGLAPLVRPLLVAGVPGVVGTLWNVMENDETAELLVRFHRHYRDGQAADDALRLAQLEMLGDPDLARSSAVAWAPFQVIGHASSPFAEPGRR